MHGQTHFFEELSLLEQFFSVDEVRNVSESLMQLESSYAFFFFSKLADLSRCGQVCKSGAFDFSGFTTAYKDIIGHRLAKIQIDTSIKLKHAKHVSPLAKMNTQSFQAFIYAALPEMSSPKLVFSEIISDLFRVEPPNFKHEQQKPTSKSDGHPSN